MNGSVEDCLYELEIMYSELNDLHQLEDSGELKNEIYAILDDFGIDDYREGTNRIVFAVGDYVYKCCHKLSAVEDNINEYELTRFIEDYVPELIPHFALSTEYMGTEYILEQERITPLHDEISLQSGDNEGELTLEVLIENAEAYEYIMGLITNDFVVADVGPKSIFNFGIKSDPDSGEPKLAILDYGYFVDVDGDPGCPECGGRLVYEIFDMLDRKKSIDKIISTVKNISGDHYYCDNPSCKFHKEKYYASRVVEGVKNGRLGIIRDRGGDRRDSRSRGGRDRGRRGGRGRNRGRSRGRGGFNR